LLSTNFLSLLLFVDKKWSSVDGSDLNIELVDVNFLDEMQDDVVVVCLINMSQDDPVANNSNGCR